MKRIKYVNIDHYTESLYNGLDSAVLLENCRSGSGVITAQNELNGIEKTLRDFISDAGGNIKHVIYPALKSGDYSKNMVNDIDLNYIIATYMEYNEGMYEFVTKTISELLSEADNSVISNAYEHIKKAVERDKSFISSIAEVGEYNIVEAFKNVEAIVDVFELLDQIRTKLADIGDRIPCENVTRKRALISTFYLYANSSIDFARYVANGIMESYGKVIRSIEYGPRRGNIDEPTFILV